MNLQKLEDDIYQYIQETIESCYTANKVLREKYFWGSYWQYMTSNFSLSLLNLCCVECNFVYLLIITICARGTWWCSWFRQCASSWKVAGLIPDGIIDIFIGFILLAALWPWA